MKILLIHDNPYPGAGAEQQFFRLRNQLRERGHDARLFTTTAGKQASNSDYECFGTTSSFRTLLQSSNPFAYVSLSNALSDFRPDVVQVNIYQTQLSPLILPLLRDVPSIYYAVWYRSICPIGTKLLPDKTVCEFSAGKICLKTGCLPLRDWIPLMYQRKLQHLWQNVFRRIVAVSAVVRDRLVAEGVPATDVIWPGIPKRELEPERSETPVVVFAGRLVKEKGVDILLRAFAEVVTKIPDAKLFIAGDGPERKRLQEFVQSLKLENSVHFTGQISQDEVERRFASAWVQVVPSLWQEPLPHVAAEAMMNGIALVASNIGGLPEIINHGVTGYLVPPGDSGKLSETITRLLGDREHSGSIGRTARQFALKHLTEEKSVDRFLNIYESVVRL